MARNLLESARVKLIPYSLAIAVIWVIGFMLWFNHFELPNNGNLSANGHLERTALWMSLPYNILDLIDPPLIKPGESKWSLFFLIQRLPFALTALAIWVGAASLGSIILRLLKIHFAGGERLFFSACLGLSFVSLIMLTLGLCGLIVRWLLIGIVVVGVVIELMWGRKESRASQCSRPTNHVPSRQFGIPKLGWVILLICIPFVLGALLGAMSPQTDFDVVEYHLGGPKEWYLQGRITRLPHNVYTSFPFLSEMLILTGMVVYGDWEWGALAGQAVIAGFAPLTAAGLIAAGKRFFSASSGFVAALVYLTSPWTYRVSIIAYAEGGLSCYLFATLYAALIYRQQITKGVDRPIASPRALTFLTGLLAGSAMACKYTGLVSVIVPIGLLLIWTTVRHARQKMVREVILVNFVFTIGVLGAVGPWLLKNAVETGNPVYPLGVRLFGGIDRDEEIDAKWRRGHANPYKSWQQGLRDLPTKLADVVANNDWHSPLMFALAPLSLLICLRRKAPPADSTSSPSSQSDILGVIWLYVGWQFLSWWLFTHHIDRFYVPMFSAVALLAGVGACWYDPVAAGIPTKRGHTIWNTVIGFMIVGSALYNANVMLCIGGFNAGRRDLTEARDRIAIADRIKWINDSFESGQFPRNAKVLCVGEALLFHARYPYLYNTVFDHSLFEELCKAPGSTDNQMRPVNEIREEFHRMGITHIDVNWSEILRYREPGNYGYTDFVHPDRFAELQRKGILGPQCLPTELSLRPLSADLQQRLEQWAPSLITTVAGKPYYVSAQFFRVIDTTPSP